MMLVHLMHASRSARAARLASSWLLELLVIGATESVVFIFYHLFKIASFITVANIAHEAA